MNKIFVQKCEEVFIRQNRMELEDKLISELQNSTGIMMCEEYRYILENYSREFLNDNYELCSKYHSPMADENGAEPFMYFIGLEGEETLFSVYEMYKEQLPDSYYPVALADGGNLICMSNTLDGIYMWIHDNENDTAYKIFDSIEQMVLMITHNENVEDDLGVIEEDVVMSDEFLAALNKLKV